MSIKLGNKKLWIGILISLFFLFLLFRKINFPELANAFKNINYWYLALAVITYFATYYFRALRWKYLLTPLKDCSAENALTVTLIGQMVNGILLAPVGQLAQSYILGEKEDVPKASVFASLVLDKICDALVILVLFIATLFLLETQLISENIHKALMAGGYIVLAVYLAGVLFLILLKIRTQGTLRVVNVVSRPLPPKWREKLIQVLDAFIHGIKLPAKAVHIIAIIATSLIIMALSIITVDFVLLSFNCSLPVIAWMLTMLLISFAVMIPASPGYLGTFQYGSYLGLIAFSVPEGQAVSISLIIYAVMVLPVIIVGFVLSWKENISLKKIAKTIGRFNHD